MKKSEPPNKESGPSEKPKPEAAPLAPSFKPPEEHPKPLEQTRKLPKSILKPQEETPKSPEKLKLRLGLPKSKKELPESKLKKPDELVPVSSPQIDTIPYLRLWDEVRYGTKIPKDDIEVTEEDLKHLTVKIKLAREAIVEDYPEKPTMVDKSTQVDEDTLDQDGDEVEDEDEDEKEAEEEEPFTDEQKRAANTGWFSDGVRRVDLVIVVAENEILESVQDYKTEFLVNVLKTGLELELEPGVMNRHRELFFIKVHAPDDVLLQFSDTFGAKNYFKDKHLQFVKPSPSLVHRVFGFSHEREWIKLVRKHYIASLNYSNGERSYMVYQILRHVRFGESVNHFGITRLIDNQIILDVYALHDGPYFFLEDQNYSVINARQILFYNWFGIRNIFKFQPLNLIHEYFGPKVGFYFAFYGFYNKSLVILAVVGVITTLLQAFDGYLVYDWFRHDACDGEYKDKDICPRCRDFNTCPFTKMKDYCLRITIMNYFDNSYWILFSLFVSCWAIFFITFWRRNEKYWIWMWELYASPQPTIRTEHDVNYKNPSKSSRTGMWKNYDGLFVRFFRVLVSRFIMTMCGFALLGTTGALIYAKYLIILEYAYEIKAMFKNTDYAILAIFDCVALFVVTLLELIFSTVSRLVTKFENHRTVEAYEGSLIVKLFSFGAGCTFSVLIFFAWLKGPFYTFPHDHWSPTVNVTLDNTTTSIPADFLGGLFLLNCGPVSCLDEVIILFAIIVVVKVVVLRIWPCFICLRTDYNQGEDTLEIVPSWEREYRLKQVTDDSITQKFNTLVLQLSLLTWFVPAFPLAPLLALLVNTWHIRHEARVMLVGSRRPLLFRNIGIGTWNGVLAFICFATAFICAVTTVTQTRAVLKYIYIKYNKDDRKLRELLNFTLVEFDTNLYKNVTTTKEAFQEYMGTKPATCLFAGLYRVKNKTQGLKMPWPFDWNNVTHKAGNFMAKEQKYTMNLFEVLYIGGFQILVLLVAMLVRYYVPMITRKVKEVVQTEINLKKAYQLKLANE